MHFAQMHLEDIFISARLCVCVCNGGISIHEMPFIYYS